MVEVEEQCHRLPETLFHRKHNGAKPSHLRNEAGWWESDILGTGRAANRMFRLVSVRPDEPHVSRSLDLEAVARLMAATESLMAAVSLVADLLVAAPARSVLFVERAIQTEPF